MCLFGALGLVSLKPTTTGPSLTIPPAKKSSTNGVDEIYFPVGATECLPTADFFHNNDLAAKPLQAMVG